MRFFRIKPRRVSSAKLDAEDEGQGLLELQHRQYQQLHEQQQCKTKPGLSSSSDATIVSQPQMKDASATEVVVLKASIHCQGCARRIRKTVSKIEGVNTFHVDIDEQKVTVIGKFCPDAVLQSVNKVIKNVEFWSPPSKPHEPQESQQHQKRQTIASLIAPENNH